MSPVRCVLSFVHDGFVRIDADEAHTISRPPHARVILYPEEKYLSQLAAPSPAHDRDRIYLYTWALKILAGLLDITSLPRTGEALIQCLLACAPSSVSHNFRGKVRDALKPWKLEMAGQCLKHYSEPLTGAA